jgi:hypothetical protein
VAYLNGSKVLTTGSALTYNGTTLALSGGAISNSNAGLENYILSNGTNSSSLQQNSTSFFFNANNNTASGGQFIWRTNSDFAEQMRLTSTGLGIGTSSPTSKLHVIGAGQVSGNFFAGFGSANAAIVSSSSVINGGAGFSEFLFGNASTNNRGYLSYSHANDSLLIGTAGATRVTLNSSGQLETGIAGSASAPSFTRTGDLNTGIFFPAADTIAFAEGGVESMRIDSAGNVGIGTSSPIVKLHVKNATDVNLGFREGQIDATAAQLNAFNDAGSANIPIEFKGSRFIWNRSNVEAMRLDSSGNLGLGVIPSASSWVSLELLGGNVITSFASATIPALYSASNAFYNSGWKYKNTNNALMYAINANSGQFQWFIAPSGTAGNAISFTQAMTLDASGKLGIGETSPQSALHVRGESGSSLVGRIVSQISSGSYLGFFDTSTTDRPMIGAVGDNFVVRTGSLERARIDSSGNLLIGTTSAISTLTVRPPEGGGIALQRPGASGTHLLISTNAGGGTPNYTTTYDTFNNDMRFSTAAAGGTGGTISFLTNTSGTATERARINSSGALLVGQTSWSFANNGTQIAASGRIFNTSNTDYNMEFAGSTSARLRFYSNAGGSGTTVGNITVDATNTQYNTSSDYRLKNITGPITTSGAYIDSLNPVEGTWKIDGSTFVGLLAHEAQEVSRTKVATGVKDGEEMQGMDYSSAEIIANLIAEIQSLRARLAAANI